MPDLPEVAAVAAATVVAEEAIAEAAEAEAEEVTEEVAAATVAAVVDMVVVSLAAADTIAEAMAAVEADMVDNPAAGMGDNPADTAVVADTKGGEEEGEEIIRAVAAATKEVNIKLVKNLCNISFLLK